MYNAKYNSISSQKNIENYNDWLVTNYDYNYYNNLDNLPKPIKLIRKVFDSFKLFELANLNSEDEIEYKAPTLSEIMNYAT
jgi:hypothetical protein